MKDVGLLFVFVNLCTLMLIINSSNPDSEVFQDSSEEDGKASRSAPLTDYRNNPNTNSGQPSRDSSGYSPGIIITSVKIPLGVLRRSSQWFLVGGPGYERRRVSSYEPRDTVPKSANNNNNNNNNNKRGDEYESRNNLDLSISGRSPGNGDRTTGITQEQEKTNILPPRIPSGNRKVSPSGVPNFSNSRTSGGNQDNQGEHVAQSKPIYVPPIPVGSNNPSNIPGIQIPNGNMPANWPNWRPMAPVRPTFQPGGENYSPSNPVSSVKGYGTQFSPIPTPISGVKSRTSPDANLFAGMINDFAFDLVRFMKLDTNFVISPLSIFNALTLCYLASDGNTEAELQEALMLNKNSVHGDVVHQSMKDLISMVAPKSSEYQLFIANGMFIGKNFTIKEDFKQKIQRFYEGQLRKVDFGDPESSMKVINNWVDEVTRNTIPSFGRNPPHPLTRILLLNAVYFKGIWKKEFPPRATYEGRFSTLTGNSKATPTMPLYNETFFFLKSAEHRHSFIKLPYAGDEISMIIALPFSNRAWPMPEMTDRILCHVRDAMKETTLDSITIPKFRLEFTKGLKKELISMGMPSLFNPKTSDFSKLRSEKDLFVTDVNHKAIVEVNEQGTIAAAKTSVNLVPLIYQNTTDFFVDHPFAFYIIHEASGLVLFYGNIFDLGD